MDATHLEYLEARLIALELLFRGMLSGLVEDRPDPIGDVDRMEDEFRSTVGFTKFGDDDERAERIRTLTIAMVKSNFAAVRSRALRQIELEAAGKPKN
ncbi:hypothetical protein [Bradyrhizobium elkanii]|uniref:hypothetical protein n=1 Tax=Bradyrhizobium elkanii TaxID=29448 RepID=UPI0004B6ADFF|nr:hypothetical protein [Bradyrhizobium elkanii]